MDLAIRFRAPLFHPRASITSLFLQIVAFSAAPFAQPFPCQLRGFLSHVCHPSLSVHGCEQKAGGQPDISCQWGYQADVGKLPVLSPGEWRISGGDARRKKASEAADEGAGEPAGSPGKGRSGRAAGKRGACMYKWQTFLCFVTVQAESLEMEAEGGM